MSFQAALGSFHLLYGETLSPVGFQFPNACGDFFNLVLQQRLLPFLADGDFFKLAVSDDNRIIIAGGNSGAEFLPVFGFKVLLLRNKNIGGGIQPQKF